MPVPAKAPSTSLVFPDGGFPDYLNSPGGSIPTRVALPGLGDLYPPLMPTPAEYDQRGLVPRGVQQPPGVPELFRPTAPPLPDYFYQPGYYYDPTGIGARPLADYGPPGHAPREDPQGEAPGVPQFTPITPPEPITAEERQKFVTRGEFPGSFLVPGTNTSFRFRGFVRLVALYDFNPIDLKDQFVTSFIPVPQQHGENFNLSARISRIALETWTPTTLCQWTVHTFIDVDFIRGPDQSFSGGSNFFRLRNAFADFGYFRLGQQNTVFQDSTAWPSTVDFAGPRGIISLRVPEARMTIPLSDKVYWATGIDQPFSDITTNGLGRNAEDVPDFATHLRYEGDFGHVQLSSVFRSIEFRPTVGATQREFGWGLSASGVVHPWALLLGSNP